MNLASRKSSLSPLVVYSTDRSKVVVLVLVLLFVALWFILRVDLFYVLPCVILFLCFSVLLALQLPRLGKRELVLVLFVCLFDLLLFGFVCFLFLLGVWEGLSFVIVALPGLFSYPFFFPKRSSNIKHLPFVLPTSVAQLDAPSDWRPGGRGFNPRRGWQHSFVEIDHEIFSTVILSLPLIQEGQLSVSGERMCTILVNRLED